MNHLIKLFSRLAQLEIFIELVDSRLKIDAPKGVLTPDLLQELKEKKEEIIEFLQKKVETQGKYVSIEPAREKDFYVLSSAQKRMYFLQQLDPESTVYNITQAIELTGEPDIERLETTFKKLIKRHESLRTSFRMIDYQPAQKIYTEVEFQVRCYEVEDDTQPFAGNVFAGFFHAFDLSQPPLFRAALVRVKNKKNLLVVIMHHIICDGISHQVLKRDFISLYNGSELPPLRLQYKDYAEWQHHRRQQGSIKKQEEYWLKEFIEEALLIDLPLDYPRPAVQNVEGGSYRFGILKQETLALKEMGLARGSSLYMVLLTIFNILLSKLCRQEDIIIGTPTAGRRHADLEGIIGMFVNTLPLRNYPRAYKTFDTFLEEVKERTLAAFENQDYQFEDLVEKVVKNRDESRNPLFDVMFSLQDQGDRAVNIPGPVEGHENPGVWIQGQKKAMFDITWVGMETGETIYLQVVYAVKLFKESTIHRFIQYFKKILSDVIGSPGIKISEIEIISAEEKKQILVDFNDTEAEYPEDKPIHRLFEEQAERTPDNIAVIGMDLGAWSMEKPLEGTGGLAPLSAAVAGAVTYRELNKKTGQLAHDLREKGVKSDTIAAIMVERSLEMIIGIFAVLKAGGAYLPIDPDYPEERIGCMLRDSEARVLVTTPGISAGVKIVNCQLSIVNCQREIARPEQSDSPLERGAPQGRGVFKQASGSLRPAASLAYVIYTSGSTGKPKGILVEHGSVVNLVISQANQFGIDERDRVLQFSSICFDASVEQIFIALLSGAVLVLVDKSTILDNNKFEEFISSRSITHLNAVPSFLSNIRLKVRHQLKRVISGGDVCPLELAREWGADCDFYNQYGPTEATVTSVRMLYKNMEEALAGLPIGKPINNTFVYLFDQQMKLVPAGIPGELYIGGGGVSRGYLNQPQLTAEKFIKGTRGLAPLLYRSGDLARWLQDGNLEFLGRIDQQVKIRGFRIELAEIEKNLQAHDEIKEAIVVAREDKQNNEALCAYFIPYKKIETANLKNFLSCVLPHYMIPSYFIPLDKMPLTPTGKIDLKALPGPKTGLKFVTGPRPQSEFEEKLIKLWSEILGIKEEQINLNSNFFELGGNSLSLLLLVTKIESDFGIRLAVTQIYNQPILGEVLKLLFARSFEDNPVVLLGQVRPQKIFCFPPQIGYGIFYIALARIIHDYAFYGLSFIEDMSHEERMQKYVEIITGIQPRGPYLFFGYSAAGKLAFQVTKALEEQGAEVSDIIFIDCYFVKETDELALISAEEKEKGINLYYKFVDDLMKGYNLSHVKPKVLEKSRQYKEYYENLFTLEPIHANVHLIMSEGAQKAKRIKPKNWEPLINKDFIIYKGFGKHQTAFAGEYLLKNAEVMKKILDKIAARDHPGQNK